MLKKGASGRDPALRDSCKCSHICRYAALSKSPRALADGLMLVFQHPVVAANIKAGPVCVKQTAATGRLFLTKAQGRSYKHPLTGCLKTAPEAVSRRCAAFVNAHMQSAGSSKPKAWLTGSEFVLSLEPQASCLKPMCVLADGLMLVFKHPGRWRLTAGGAEGQRHGSAPGGYRQA